MPSAGALRHCQLHRVQLQPHTSKCSWSRVRADRICGRGNQGRRLQTCRWLWDSCRLCQVTSQCTMCSLFRIFLRATEQAQAYLKIWVLVSHWTYICPSFFECAQKYIFWRFRDFPPKHASKSTPSSLNMPLLFIVVDSGSFWIQGHRTEQSTHCALYTPITWVVWSENRQISES